MDEVGILRGQMAAIKAAVLDDDTWIGLLAPTLEALHFGASIHDNTARVRFMNQAGNTARAQRIVGSFDDLQVWDLNREPLGRNAPVPRCIATGETQFGVVGVPSKEGDRWVAIMVMPILGPDFLTWCIAHYRDVTRLIEQGLPVPDLAAFALT